jgi:hypothetical protein
MREQVKLLHKIMKEVLYYPFNGEATHFTVHYEVFHVTDAILYNKQLNPAVTKHITNEQINALYNAGLTEEDVKEVQQQSGRNIDLLYTVLGDLMVNNNITVMPASYELCNIVFAPYREQRYPGNYKQVIHRANVTEVEFSYVNLSYRLESIKGMMQNANVPPRLAIDKLRSCTEQQVREQWWAALSTRNDIQAIVLEHMRNGMQVETVANSILEFVKEGKSKILTPAQQDLLKQKNPLFVLYQFNANFFALLNKQFKMTQLQPQLTLWSEKFTNNVTRDNDTESSLKMLMGQNDFVDCYQHNRCRKLFSQINVAAAIDNLATINFTTPSNETVEAALPTFFKNSQEYLNHAYAERHGFSSSFLLMAASMVSENAMLCEVSVIVILSAFLFRNKLALLNPFRYFYAQAPQNDNGTVEELMRLTQN